MEQIRIEHLTFSYGTENAFSLQDISATIQKGQFVLVVGVSGCGKTTLLRHLKVDYLPNGIRGDQTAIYVNGISIEDMSERDRAGLVGYVRQNPESAQAMDKVWHELAFGLESLGYPQEQMQRKVAEMVAFFGLEKIYEEKLCNLSGGEKQLVNLASVMVMEPEVLVLDEPTSQLDPVAATQFFSMVERIHRELGTTIVMTEHRVEEVYGLCDRVIVMDQGRVICDGDPGQAAAFLWEKQHRMFDALPSATRIYLQLKCEAPKEKTALEYKVEQDVQAEQKPLFCMKESDRIPLTVKEGRSWLAEWAAEKADCKPEAEGETPESQQDRNSIPEKRRNRGERFLGNVENKENAAIIADEIWFRYEAKGKDILKACSLAPERGKVTAILGGNGAGKSTLLHVLAGHSTPLRGKIRLQTGRIALLPQNPQAMFAKDTVWEELCASAGIKDSGNAWSAVERTVPSGQKEASEDTGRLHRLYQQMEAFGLREVLRQHPFDLSGGQMQMLALAKLILADYDVLLLDEPGKGMDYHAKSEMGAKLQQLAAQGKTIVLVSHDVEFCARYADVCGLFFDGHIVSLMETRSFFLQNVFYTTAVCRMCRKLIDTAVTVEDVLRYSDRDEKTIHWNKSNDSDKAESQCNIGWGKQVVNYSQDPTGMEKPVKTAAKQALARKHNGIPWIKILIFAIFFLCIPITIYFGHTVLQQRKYYFISLLLVLEALAAFFLSFEKGSPKLRDMMIVSVMTAITVAGRAAFYMVPNVKPMAALTILSGIGLGSEAGFLIGALSMLISNIFFGQGPWTPWQMVAMGLLGCLGGLVFRNEKMCSWKKVAAVCVFGFLSVLVIYGGIMNPASVLMYQEHVNRGMILSAYAMGLPFDLLHAGGTAVFLLIGTRPILKKLYRIERGGN